MSVQAAENFPAQQPASEGTASADGFYAGHDGGGGGGEASFLEDSFEPDNRVRRLLEGVRTPQGKFLAVQVDPDSLFGMAPRKG